MNLLHLQYFCRVAEKEHYLKAAEELYVTQSNLSYAIATLEKELGVRLFEKRGRNVILTHHGRIYYEYVRKALSLLEEGKSQLLNDYATTTTIHVGCCRIWFLFSIINTITSAKVNMAQCQHPHILEGLVNGSYTFGLLEKPINDSRFSCHAIRDLPFVLLVPLNHHLAQRWSVDLREVKDDPFILRDSGSSLYREARALFEKIDVVPNIVNETSSNEILGHLVEQGFGLGICTDIPSLKNIKVARLPISYPKHTNRLYLTWLNDREMSPTEKHIISQLVHKYAVEPG